MATRVDAHVHVWRAAEGATPNVSTLMSPQTEIPIDLLAETLDDHGVDRAVLVQPVFRGEDNSYVADCAAMEPARFAAVCVVDPRVEGAADRLAYWVRERGCKGLRLRPRVDAEAAIFSDPASFPLWESATRLDIVVSVLASTEHLPAVDALADRFPTVPIVIDHFAHPHVERAVRLSWQALMQLAKHQQVHVKTSGYYYFSSERHPYRDCWPLLRAVYDAFGPQRMIWGSDFPHVLLSTGYARSLRFVDQSLDWLSDADREAILGGNALRLYWPS